MEDNELLKRLRKADAAAELPRLGGMARPGGVAIVSEAAWAFASVGGGVEVRRMPQPPTLCRRVPLLRGLVRLGAALMPLLTQGGPPGRRDRLVVLCALGSPAAAELLPGPWQTPVAALLALSLIVWMLRGPTLRLHGAEHRAIAAAESRTLEATWTGAARPSRISLRCGTNLTAILVPVTLGVARLWTFPTAALTPLLVSTVALTLTMELWLLVQHLPTGVTRVILSPGLVLQRLTTREPTLAETRVALRALAATLEADPSAT